MSPLPSPSFAAAPADFTPRRGTLTDRWSPGEAARVLAHAASTGLSLFAYARKHGLCVRQLYWWRCRLAGQTAKRQGPAAPEAPLRFVAVGPAHAGRGSGVSLRVGAARIDVEPGFCEQTLARTLAVAARAAIAGQGTPC